MARQFIYHMQGLSKSYPGNRKILENINLSFYPDAKIGVLGVNGAGKSTLLKIMAGIDKDYTGEAWVAEGARVGYLEQEPQLDPKLTVRENVMQGVAKQKAILDRYNELAVNYSEETADESAGISERRYRLPFAGGAATSASTFPINVDCFQRKRDGAPIRLFHAGSVQDLSVPQGAR